MQRRRSPFQQIILVMLLAVLVAACSGPGAPQEVDVALFNDNDVEQAVLELATSSEELAGTELGEVPDGAESDLAESLASDLATQAVLPGSGGYLAYLRHNPNSATPWQLWLADQTTDTTTQVYAGTRQIQSVAVSLDGSILTVAMKRTATSSNYEIYKVVVGSSSLARLTSTATPESNVSISADGTIIAWEGASPAGKRAIFIRRYEAGGGFSTSLLARSTHQVQPSLSGDGNFVAFVRKLSGKDRVMRYNRANNSYLSVTTSSNRLEHPSVSNGGSKVAWLERRSSGDRVRVKTLSSGAISNVVSSLSIEHPFLTADGRFLSYGLKQSGNWSIFTKDVTTGQGALAVAASGSANLYASYWQKSAAASTSLTAVEVARGLSQPTAIAHPGNGSGRLFITLRGGKIVVLDDARILDTPFLDVGQLVSTGLMDVAFHPNYKDNRYFYINYVDKDRNTVVARYTTQLGNPNVADPNSAKIILTINEATSNHWGGQTKFGPDGYLYLSVGDGGPQGDPNNNAQNRGNLLGTMLRIDVDGGDPYTVPASNPFTNVSGAKGEIWAYGLRNPWRFSFDRATGDLFIGDVGYEFREEINFQPASSRGGENYGWRQMEGSACYNPGSNCNDGTLVLPILEYATGENCSVTGGYRYRGDQMPELKGTYIYGDYCSGRIWGATLSNGRWTSRQLLKTPYSIVSFGEDEAGEIYLADFSQGGIYRLEAR